MYATVFGHGHLGPDWSEGQGMMVAIEGVTNAISAVRQAYEKALMTVQPSRVHMEWRLSRFDRGLKLASEITATEYPVHGKHVLDLGAHHGGDTCALVACGAQVTAVDFVDHGYATLRRHIFPVVASPGRFAAVLANANERLPFADESFDVILAMGLVEHVKDLKALFKEMYGLLRPGGLLVLEINIALKTFLNDPLFHLPATSLLPMRLRRFIAETICGKRYPFPLAQRTFYTGAFLLRFGRAAGFDVKKKKFRDSPLMARVTAWPLPRVWQALMEHYAFDIIVMKKRGLVGASEVVRLNS